MRVTLVNNKQKQKTQPKTKINKYNITKIHYKDVK